MFRKLLKSLRQYKKQSALSLIFIIGEVVLEVVIPFITAQMVNNFRDGAQMSMILQTGGCALGVISTKSSSRLSAMRNAWFVDMMPSI